MSAKLRFSSIPKAGLLWVAAVSLLTVNASAQQLEYPTFVGLPNNQNQITSIVLNGSPALAQGPDDHLWVAYADVNNNNGDLSVASSPDGVNFTVHQTSVNTGTFPAMTTSGGRLLEASMLNSSVIQIVDVTNGTVNSTVNYEPIGPIFDSSVALWNFGGTLYLAWRGVAFDPDTGGYDGNWINVATGPQNGSSFTWSGNPIGETYTAGSGPAMAQLGSTLVLTYLDGATGNPQLFDNGTPGSASFTNNTGSAGAGGHYADDPALVYFQNAMFPMFTSAFSEDNLWAIATTDGVTGDVPPLMYGQTLTNSPSLAVANNGTLYEGGRSNFPGSGAFLWVYSATGTNTVAPADTGGGGTGGGGGGTGGCNGARKCNQ